MKLPQLYDIFREKWEKFNNIWLISDSHFSDDELAVGAKRAMSDEDYVKLINSKVGKKDMILHLGDVGNIEWVRKIRAGHKVLIMGNHDAGASNYKRIIEQEIFDAKQYDKKSMLAEMREKYPGWKINVDDDEHFSFHSPFIFYVGEADNGLFDEVYTGPLMVAEKLLLSHEPIHGWDGMFNIHGHVHDPKAKDNAHHFNVCPDATGRFEPISFKEIIEGGYMSKVQSQHRATIDNATKRARKRGKN